MSTISTAERTRHALTLRVASVDQTNATGALAAYDLVGTPGAGKRIVVTGYSLGSNANVQLTWRSHETTLLKGFLYTTYALAAQLDRGVFACAENEKLAITLSGNCTAVGWISYVLEDV